MQAHPQSDNMESQVQIDSTVVVELIILVIHVNDLVFNFISVLWASSCSSSMPSVSPLVASAESFNSRPWFVQTQFSSTELEHVTD